MTTNKVEQNLTSFGSTVSFNNNELVKNALIFYESTPTCSAGKTFDITKDVIYKLVQNTNEYLNNAKIKLFKEHKKDIDNEIGEIDSPLVAREITVEDAVKNPKWKSLVGKLGIWSDSVKIKDANVIQKLANNIGGTISAGIDFTKHVIKEVSCVGLPSLDSATLFNDQDNLTRFNSLSSKLISNFNMDTTAVTLEEAIQEKEDDEQLKSEAIELLCKFMAVVENIVAMSDEDLGNYQVASKDELYQSQLETFMMMLDEKINPFNQETMDQEQGQIDPRMQPNQMQRYSAPLAITTFDEMDQYISEYGLGRGLKLGLGLAKKVGASGGGIGAKAKAFGGGLARGTLGNKKVKAIGSAITGAKTGIANKATSGLQKAGAFGNKLGAKKPGGFLKKVGTGIQKSSASLADKISNRRLGRYSSSSKLSKFMK